MVRRTLWLAVICIGLASAACGSDETPSDPTTPPAGTVQPDAPEVVDPTVVLPTY